MGFTRSCSLVGRSHRRNYKVNLKDESKHDKNKEEGNFFSSFSRDYAPVLYCNFENLCLLVGCLRVNFLKSMFVVLGHTQRCAPRVHWIHIFIASNCLEKPILKPHWYIRMYVLVLYLPLYFLNAVHLSILKKKIENKK